MLPTSFFKPVQLSQQAQFQIMKQFGQKEPDKVQQFTINLSLINSKCNMNGRFEFFFSNLISLIKFTGLGSINTIDKNVLKEKLEAFIKPQDKKYIKLESFTYQNARYTFNVKEWLDDGLKGVKGKLFMSKWDREYKIKILPPYMIRAYAIRLDMEKYIASYFKDYIKNNVNLKKEVLANISEEWIKLIGIKPENLFDIKYEYMNNKVMVKLKDIYVGLLLTYGVSMMNKKMYGTGRI